MWKYIEKDGFPKASKHYYVSSTSHDEPFVVYFDCNKRQFLYNYCPIDNDIYAWAEITKMTKAEKPAQYYYDIVENGGRFYFRREKEGGNEYPKFLGSLNYGIVWDDVGISWISLGALIQDIRHSSSVLYDIVKQICLNHSVKV